jgi:general stress protein CsbA
VRSIMLLGADFSTIYGEIIALIIIDASLLIVGFYLFDWIEKRTKKSGTISHY